MTRTRGFPTKSIAPVGNSRWTGADLREWAEVVARRIDAGVIEVQVDLDRWGRAADTWKVNVFRKEEA